MEGTSSNSTKSNSANSNNEERTPKEKKLFKVAIISIIVSSFVLLSSVIGEFVFQELSIKGIPFIDKRAKKQKPKKKLPAKAFNVLPEGIDKLKVIARQEVPGKPNAAEALYEPKEEIEISPSNPVATYVRITYHDSQSQAKNQINKSINSKYSDGYKIKKVYKNTAYTGFSEDYSTYYQGWVWNEYSIEVESTYRIKNKSPKKVLYSLSDMVTKEIIKNILELGL